MVGTCKYMHVWVIINEALDGHHFSESKSASLSSHVQRDQIEKILEDLRYN